MTTAANAALNEPRALRLILADPARKDAEQRMQTARMVPGENVAGVLAGLVADEMVIADGPKKAARKLEKRLVFLPDFAAGGMLDGDDQ